MKSVLQFVFILIISVQLQAQQKIISGIVSSSSDGLPLPGASVMIKGTTIGTQTDFDGKYTLLASEGDILQFTYVGFKTQEIKLRKETMLNITLEADNTALEEVVVVGYGATRKSFLSRSDRRHQRKNGQVAQTLSGQIAGVNVGHRQNGAYPIRGNTSVIRNNKPLYIVDGIAVTSQENIDVISPNDIKSTTILKSQEATAMYGARGANGVIIVNTKQGNYKPNYPELTNEESYAEITENQFERVSLSPLSTFSIDVDKASYSNIRRMINNGQKIPPDAVRIEEMINYFNYNYPQPTGQHPFSIHTEVAKTPWNVATKIVKIGLQGKSFKNEELPASNLTFLIDVSGSMNSANKLPLLKSAFKLLVNQLRAKDKIAIVVYAGAAGMVLPPTSGADKEKISNALNNLSAGGSTAGGAGIELAYEIAQENFIKNGNNRVILATDGDFNVGASSDKDMEKLIEEKRESGVFLSVLGFGFGNYKDSKLETLANKGNGNHAYIDTMQEAQKTFGKEFGGTLYTIAKDVKIQIEFNPKKVQAYRLIGYENRLLADEDFIDDTKDAGELGSGHTVTALYEVIPTGVKSDYLKDVDDLKYTETTVAPEYSDELFTVKFRYKKPNGVKSIEMAHIQKDEVSEPSEDLRFAASVALLGMQLRASKFDNKATLKDITEMAKQGRGSDANGYRSEFIRLVESYQNL
ncbi:VWA domain-containing protein [Gelidibacter maritimus]|uniref:von Willebrand factor type A domain-containing protein n=1 Tax=Gelidibacter maritimus TaxID=2761487 RepID=A0A7W2R521_9FLAO|nr:VWA domain-containing protein [Gelidibacter maritimus]MBA6153670.1 von Willebrand factor type A domain-containing protein [Gelidibacter maritimus]